ncbi:MAG: hypothetical protein AB7L13_18690 [Acidimicrobiia bacterium]
MGSYRALRRRRRKSGSESASARAPKRAAARSAFSVLTPPARKAPSPADPLPDLPMLAAHPALLRRTVIGVFLGLVLIVAISAVAGGMDGRAPQSFFAAALDPAPTPSTAQPPLPTAATLVAERAGETASPAAPPAPEAAGGADADATPVVVDEPASQAAPASSRPRTTVPASPPEVVEAAPVDVTRVPAPDTTATKKNVPNAGASSTSSTTVKPVPAVVAPKATALPSVGKTSTSTSTSTTAPTTCDPNYSPCVPIAAEVDCADGAGNGPTYVTGPVKVIGRDVYHLDSDGDGIGCDR